MIFYLIGINYKTVNLSVREKACLLKKEFIQFLNVEGLSSARILSTCNRFEIYDFAKDNEEVLRRLNILKSSFSYFLGKNYTFVGEKKVFRHLLRLACGLESQAKGESQIQEQLINFYSQDSFPQELKEIMDKAIDEATFIRNKSGIDRKNYNIADLILEDIAKKINTKPLKIAIIGTGKIAELFASDKKEGVQFYFLARKNYERANALAKNTGGQAATLDEIEKVIFGADALISATKSPHYILTQEILKKIMDKRKRALYIYDLAIPRDIDPQSSKVGGVILKNMDDLGPLFEKHNRRIEKELVALENFVAEQTAEFERGFYEENIAAGYAR
jgi:glutamyl-tRNA reductase